MLTFPGNFDLTDMSMTFHFSQRHRENEVKHGNCRTLDEEKFLSSALGKIAPPARDIHQVKKR